MTAQAPPGRPEGAEAVVPHDALIRLRGLQKHYGRRRALAGIDLTLDGTQIVGIVGPDGAGKTTLIRALAGLLEISALRRACSAWRQTSSAHDQPSCWRVPDSPRSSIGGPGRSRAG